MKTILLVSYAVYAILLLLCFYSVVKFVLSSKRKGQTPELPVRILTAAGTVAVILYCIIARKCVSGSFAVYLAFVMSPVFLTGLCGRNPRLRLVPAVVVDALAAIAIIVSCLAPVKADVPLAAVLLMAAVLVVFTGQTVWRLSASLRRFDGLISAKESLRAVADVFYLAVLVFLLCLGRTLGGHVDWGCAGGTVVCVALLCGLVAAHDRRRAEDKVFLLFPDRDNRLNEARRMEEYEPLEGVKLNQSYENLFIRVKDCFENEKPYLDPNMSLVQVANRLLTNKQYLSFTINAYTGKNFCQFANYYRIRHFMELYRNNSSRKISELALESGFRTTHSLTMAFRLNMNTSPGQWCRKNKCVK